MNQITMFQYIVVIGDGDDDWVSAETLLSEPTFLLDAYCARDTFTRNDIVGGFRIDFDGQPWSDVGTIDQLGYTASWLFALQTLLTGGQTARAIPWEESQLRLTRTQTVLEMEDVHPTGLVNMRRVRVPIVLFTNLVLQAGTQIVALVDGLRRAIAQRRVQPAQQAQLAKLDVIENALPTALEAAVTDLSTALEQFVAKRTDSAETPT